MPHTSVVSLIHAAGFLTGIALYAMLGWMTLRDDRASAGGVAPDRIPLVTAILGLLWNTGALVYFGASELGLMRTSPLIGIIAFGALGFLPAAVVQTAVRDFEPGPRRGIIGLAFGVSTVAFVMQAATIGSVWTPDRAALLVLTVGYAAVLLVLAVRVRLRRGSVSALGLAGLAVFAVMSLHLSQHRDDGSDSLIAELIGHQGSLPLVLVILYQDFRFAFADLFLKRAITLLALVTVAITAYLQLIAPVAARIAGGALDDSRNVGLVIVFAIAVALLAPWLQRAAATFVDRVVLRRADYAAVRQSLVDVVNRGTSIPMVLDGVCRVLQSALVASRVAFSQRAPLRDDATWSSHLVTESTLVIVDVATADEPPFVLTVSPLRGGRRLLSDDLLLLESAALLAARRIDALRVEQERFDRAAAELEIRRLVSEAELRALRAQLNPHFLFNALTTIGHLLTEAPERARSTLLRLTELLRAVLRPTATELVTVAAELEIVTAYLEIEGARLEERLQYSLEVPALFRSVGIPPMLVQPLVENAVKHGIAPLKRGGAVIVQLSARTDDGLSTLFVSVRDTGAGATIAAIQHGRAHGVGLSNVEQRLLHQFGERAGLTVESVPDIGTNVTIWLPVTLSLNGEHALAGTGEGSDRGRPRVRAGHHA